MNNELIIKCHLWIGTSVEDETNYMSYFELDYSTQGNFDSPDYERCQFCLDVGLDWYDEDEIVIVPRIDEEVDLDTLLAEVPIHEKEKGKVKEDSTANTPSHFRLGDGAFLASPVASG